MDFDSQRLLLRFFFSYLCMSKKGSEGKRDGKDKDRKESNEPNADKLQEKMQAMINEYLAYMGYPLTIDMFVKEKKKKMAAKEKKNSVSNKKNGEVKVEPSENKEEEYHRCFDDGDGPKFFMLLNKQFPVAARKKYSTLWFRLHVYFAIYPILNPTLKPNGAQEHQLRKSMDYFKRFLEKNGNSANTALLPYYGLPFIVNPREHPTFSHLFEDEFITTLKTDLFQMLLEKSQPKIMRLTHEIKLLKESKDSLQGSIEHRTKMASEAMQVLFFTAMDLFETLALYHTQIRTNALRWLQEPPDDARLSYAFLLKMKKKLANFHSFLRTWDNPAAAAAQQADGPVSGDKVEASDDAHEEDGAHSTHIKKDQSLMHLARKARASQDQQDLDNPSPRVPSFGDARDPRPSTSPGPNGRLLPGASGSSSARARAERERARREVEVAGEAEAEGGAHLHVHVGDIAGSMSAHKVSDAEVRRVKEAGRSHLLPEHERGSNSKPRPRRKRLRPFPEPVIVPQLEYSKVRAQLLSAEPVPLLQVKDSTDKHTFNNSGLPIKLAEEF